MLGHVLWRKTSPDRVTESESLLTDEIFDLLVREEWQLAKLIGRFAIELPDKKVDLQNKISLINYAQALKWSGDHSGAMKILDEVDWSPYFREFAIRKVEVIRGNYDNAAKLMVAIGKTGELVLESGYREWPIFREFRKTPQFAAAFSQVYGTEFAETGGGFPTGGSLPNNESTEDVAPPADVGAGQPLSTTGESEMPSKQPTEQRPEESSESKSSSKE